MRKPIIAGNWKMYKDVAQTCAFFEKLRPLVAAASHCEVVVCPPFVDLMAAVASVQDTAIQIGGQNLFWKQEGAYTGEISGTMLQAIGCRWVLIGHSERRQYFGETDATVHSRIHAALEAGLKPIVCVGEVLLERESGQTNEVLRTQFDGALASLTPEQFAQVTIAYEPVWAIGTGKTATPEIAAETQAEIRKFVADAFGAEAAASVRILYGGSVKPDNVKSLMAQDDIDGALVGGASLDPVSFAALVNYHASV
jgi:triosephosphate isomerase